ncbi:MAG: TusE/DsrC/DsvC family sulfur relay protein, partial [Chlorobiales bacterium]|nr:TusE/DsrC/DsvC family sulfur relay protein [Chlorobiales bacterium]
MALEVNCVAIETDDDGYLVNLDDWSEDVANKRAEAEDIKMAEEHWSVVNFLREYYDDYQIAPAVKVLTKAIAKERDMDKKAASEFLY